MSIVHGCCIRNISWSMSMSFKSEIDTERLPILANKIRGEPRNGMAELFDAPEQCKSTLWRWSMANEQLQTAVYSCLHDEKVSKSAGHTSWPFQPIHIQVFRMRSEQAGLVTLSGSFTGYRDLLRLSIISKSNQNSHELSPFWNDER